MKILEWIKSKPYGKGTIIGFFLGIFWVISAFVGMNVCNWTIVGGPVLQTTGFCASNIVQLLFFAPFAFTLAVVFFSSLVLVTSWPSLTSWLPEVYTYLVIPILIVVTTFLGGIVGWIIRSIKASIKK